jgi:hypothetical protein
MAEGYPISFAAESREWIRVTKASADHFEHGPARLGTLPAQGRLPPKIGSQGEAPRISRNLDSELPDGVAQQGAVLAEARRGDPAAANRRLVAAEGIEILNATQEAESLASALLRAAAMPAKAAIDAVHVALATVHGIDYLLTWNCTHIANAVTRPLIEAVCRGSGFQPPVICTPEELVAQEAT